MKPHRRALATAATALALAATALGTVPAFAAGPGKGATKNVDYLGRTFTIPADWPVIDLADAPRTCVRFDQHALYLGAPGADQDCPSHLIGRTEALLVQPAAGEPAGTTVNGTGQEIDAADGTVRITAAYGTDQALVTGILNSAAIPAKAPAKAATLGARALTASAVPATATNWTGKGFDACAAPSSSLMAGWMADSPYRAVGIYIGGSQRGCAQPNLTAGWVSQQAAAGWHFMPLYVGVQASGISSPASQGAAAADDAINSAVNLGLSPGSVLYYDMEAYSSTYSSKVLAFESAWTERLHARGYLSAIYSSSDSGIGDLVNHASSYTMPDVVYFARWNGTANTNDPSVPASYWSGHQRVHQYTGNTTESYHGYSLEIDADYLDVQVAQEPAAPAAGVLFHDVREANGSWEGFAPLEGVGTPTMLARETAIAGMPDGTAQVVGIGSDGNVYHETRLANGSWTGFAPLAGVGTPTMQASKVAIAGMPDGSSQVVAVGSDGNVYHETRLPNASWTGFAPLNGVGTPTMLAREVAIAGMPDGSSQVVAVGSDGNVYHETRLPNASWTGFAPLNGVGTPTMLAREVAIAGMPDGSSQVVAVGSDGNVYHETRLPNASWTGFAPLVGVGTPTMQASKVAIAGMPDGSSQVVAVGSDGNVYHETRLPNASWTGFAPLVGVGTPTMQASKVAIAGMPDGSSQVVAVGSDGNVYHETRLPNASWTGFAPLNGVGTPTMLAREVAIAGMPDGSSQVVAVGSDGNVYHETRLPNASWTGFAPLVGVGTPTMQASKVAIAGMPDGSSQVVAVGSDGNVYHETRLPNASWTGFAPLDGVGTPKMHAFEVAIAGLPNGTSQVLAIGDDHRAYSRDRLTDGTWTAFGPTPGHDGATSFPAQRVAVTALPDGSTQVLATTL